MTQIKGIDVSKHQGIINWDKVKGSDIQFAMLRCGFGGDYNSQDDEQFAHNVAECERVGLHWGVYIYSYALNLEEARSEVNHVRRLLAGKRPSYPVAFDMEDADGYKKKHGMPSNESLVDICDTFLSAMENDGHYAILYASLSWLSNQLNSSKLDRYDKWVAQWSTTCTYAKPFGLWQYTSDGLVDGISGRVDMNYAYKDYASITSPAPQPAPAPTPAPVPVTPPPAPKKRYIVLPASEKEWRIYPLDKTPIRKNALATTLKPAKFNGLEYEILKDRGNWVFEIQTQMFGRVQIYGDPSVTSARVIQK